MITFVHDFSHNCDVTSQVNMIILVKKTTEEKTKHPIKMF